jgi:predicted CoA-binding protein
MWVAAVEISSDPQHSAHEVVKEMERCYEIIQILKTAENKSGYQVEKLLTAVTG